MGSLKVLTNKNINNKDFIHCEIFESSVATPIAYLRWWSKTANLRNPTTCEVSENRKVAESGRF